MDDFELAEVSFLRAYKAVGARVHTNFYSTPLKPGIDVGSHSL